MPKEALGTMTARNMVMTANEKNIFFEVFNTSDVLGRMPKWTGHKGYYGSHFSMSIIDMPAATRFGIRVE